MVKFSNYTAISWDLFDIDKAPENTHSILVPQEALTEFLGKITDDNSIIYVEITSSVSTNPKFRCLVFSNVSSSYTDNVVVLPKWSMNKLGIEECSPVTIEDIHNLRKASHIRLKANRSDYVKWDNIKELLERELISYKCISLDDHVVIYDVDFTVTRILDAQKMMMIDCSLFNTDVNIEFDRPDDLVELDKLKMERAKIQQEEMERQRQLIKEEQDRQKTEEEERLKRLNGPINREQIAAMYDKLFSS
jgi:hypothetical protein